MPFKQHQVFEHRIGGKVTTRVLENSVARWLPIVGAVGVAGYAYYDTSQVGQNAMGFFSRKIPGRIEKKDV